MIKNPDYRGFKITYEQYCENYRTDSHFASLFGPPESPTLWNSVNCLKIHIQRLKETPIVNSVSALIRRADIEAAEARLEYLLSLDNNSTDTN